VLISDSHVYVHVRQPFAPSSPRRCESTQATPQVSTEPSAIEPTDTSDGSAGEERGSGWRRHNTEDGTMDQMKGEADRASNLTS
jgi:hypothetical protein